MKLSIICALSHSPKLLILDEATTGLDPVARDEILDLFLDFIQDETHAVFFSSHIISDIQKIADYVIFIHQGKVIFEEQKDDLIYHYGILKCRRSEFAALSPKDYLISRQSSSGIECLVKDKEKVKRKYKNMIVTCFYFSLFALAMCRRHCYFFVLYCNQLSGIFKKKVRMPGIYYRLYGTKLII